MKKGGGVFLNGKQKRIDVFDDGILNVFYGVMVAMNSDCYKFTYEPGDDPEDTTIKISHKISEPEKKEELTYILWDFLCRWDILIKIRNTRDGTEWRRAKQSILKRTLWELKELMGRNV